MIDIVEMRNEVNKGLLEFYVNKNKIMCTDPESGEVVCVGEVDDGNLRTIEEIKAQNKQFACITDGISIPELEIICRTVREGKFMVLPCKVGDTVWLHDWREKPRKNLYQATVMDFNINKNNINIEVNTHGNSNFAQNNNWNGGCYNADAIGKNIFLTREEAEVALAEMEAGE